MIIYKSRTAILAIISVFAGIIHTTTAHADTPLADFKTVTSKAYVDSLIGNAITTLSWTSAESGAVTGYGTTFDSSSTHTAGNWLYQTEDNLINTTALANALSLKQNIIQAGTADDVMTYSGTAGTTGTRGVLSTFDTVQNGLIGGYNDTFSGATNTWATDPQTGLETGSWAESEATKLVSVNAFAKGLAKKQNKIAATSANLTFDNTNPQSAQAKSAGYSVVTTSGVAGSTGQIGVANEALYITSNNETTLVNGEWIPNIYALDKMLTSATSGTINGMAVAGTDGYFYDNAGGGAASSCAKTASIPSIGTLASGQVIVVTPANTSTCANAHTLALNGGTAAPIYYNGAAVSDATTGALVWTADVPSTFVYDGTNWVFMGHGVDNAYDTMTVTAGRTGTGTTGQLVSPKNLKATVHGLTLSTVSGTDATALSLNTTQTAAITTSDTIIGAFGKLQGQIYYIKENLNYTNINGASIYGQSIYFAGVETGEPSTTDPIRSVKITGMPLQPSDKMVVVVTPIVNADPSSHPGVFDSGGLAFNMGGGSEYRILYNGAHVTDATAPIVWAAGVPSIFVFDAQSSVWLFAGHGLDNDTGAYLQNHKVNGAPLSNLSSYYLGEGVLDSSNDVMNVNIPSIPSVSGTSPDSGQVIVVTPGDYLTNTLCKGDYWKLKLNDFDAEYVIYYGEQLSCNKDKQVSEKEIVWSSGVPSMFVYDGKSWVFLGHGADFYTDYTALNSDASGEWSGPAGTGTAAGVISPQTLKNSIHRVNLTANSGTTAWAATNSRMGTSDTMLGALGKAQGQIDNRQYVIPQTGKYTTHSGTSWSSPNISDYDAAAVKGTSLPTKTGTAGAVGERMIVDSGTDTSGWATAKLNNAIPSMSTINTITAGMQKVCYEYKPGTDLNNATDADCWLWRLP